MRQKAFKKISFKQISFKKMLPAALAGMFLLAGCGNTGGAGGSGAAVTIRPVIVDTPAPTQEPSAEQEAPTAEPEVSREGMYRSELTNEWIDESLRNQRPIAVMVDNEKIALPHYGLTEADIVYEMMNSTMNGRITRFMAIVKDWGKIEQFGSIRSTRSTNIYLMGEWNSVLCHDGGPFYAMDLIKEKAYCENFSGTFSRVKNGKPTEYTEYIVAGDLERNFKSKKYSTEYNEFYPGPHYTFSDESFDLTDAEGAFGCTEVGLGGVFPHNGSNLKYNAQTGTYDYYEYGEAHLDPQHDNAPLTFKNLLIQSCEFVQLDKNGYMVYNVIDTKGNSGYYLTNGKAVKVTWYKKSDTDRTYYINDSTGKEISLNTGKTYIAIVPADTWGKVEMK